MPSTAAWSAASLSPVPDERRRRERRGLGDAHELEREVAVGQLLGVVFGAHGVGKPIPAPRATTIVA